jgi:phospholipid/cholesterol/gamma-HCH transport system ATP-binding protein
MDAPASPSTAKVTVRDLTMAYGKLVVMHDLNFEVQERDIFVIMGGSGCGKSTLLRHLIGLLEPAQGSILYGGEDFTSTPPADRAPFIRRFGVMYQSGALWSSLTLGGTSPCPWRKPANSRPRR